MVHQFTGLLCVTQRAGCQVRFCFSAPRSIQYLLSSGVGIQPDLLAEAADQHDVFGGRAARE